MPVPAPDVRDSGKMGDKYTMEQKKTILIVEDEKNIVDIIRFNLQRTGYDTLEAYDGEAGLAMAREKSPT